MNIKIKFGVDVELNRIKKTIKKLDWYYSKGYKPKLPDGINKDLSSEEIKEKIIEKFNEDEYKKISKKIEQKFKVIEYDFFEKLQDIFGKNILKEFCIYLIAYGVYGSYEVPNTIYLRFNQKDITKTIVHEIVHLIIENKIQKYKVDQWEKERIVDLILNSKEFYFLNYNF